MSSATAACCTLTTKPASSALVFPPFPCPPCPQVLPIEVLHGFTFALAWGAGCAYCQQLAPPGLEATSQGLFQGAMPSQPPAA